MYIIYPKIVVVAETANIVQFLLSDQCDTKYKFINETFLAIKLYLKYHLNLI